MSCYDRSNSQSSQGGGEPYNHNHYYNNQGEYESHAGANQPIPRSGYHVPQPQNNISSRHSYYQPYYAEVFPSFPPPYPISGQQTSQIVAVSSQPTTALETGTSNNNQGCDNPAPKRKRKAKDKPKRPLSAYNIFFQEERNRILESIPDKDKKTNENESEGPAAKKNPKKKRPHGKIDFEGLAKQIGQKWKNIGSEELERCKKLAAKDTERYEEEMKEYRAKLEEVKNSPSPQENKKQKAETSVESGAVSHHGSEMVYPHQFQYAPHQHMYRSWGSFPPGGGPQQQHTPSMNGSSLNVFPSTSGYMLHNSNIGPVSERGQVPFNHRQFPLANQWSHTNHQASMYDPPYSPNTRKK